MRGPILLLLLALPAIRIAAADEAGPHRPAGIRGCTQCHATTPDRFPGSGPGRLPGDDLLPDGIGMCTGCHAGAAASHPLGEPLDFEVPPDLPLTESRTMTCLTCHYAHGELESDRPWASVSLMDRLTNSERMHKSFLLRRNNADGELCLVCHDTSGNRP
ncbi:MAG: hypothetical protein D6786_08075 [Gammaproteobacteria bacterium]|nr:MAG: hypothetical protein D6786_08075 [Gammaproteobacteria bacterium]